ncbi:hypothetical protein FFWV33_07945 [Flavobacterium faecale]|uniref:SGNH/GDSL hydrolase family protein n=1 Tax=Flavobacterium faecale TaxID=1355330 RepID=A0A2S1LCN7_9FLAO|nr:hypothetical protein [Flavobacterium faecale]AWG21471.1 hypothetical protein FFWV33_07945 [Flavobacterium faecale]
MKKFLLFILKSLVAITIILVVLDLGYTKIYKQSSSRGKVDQVYGSTARKYDIVILGSSRANNHFVSKMFEDKGLKTFNYGMSGAHLFEADLLLKLMLERNYQIKNIIIEVDLNLSNDKRADGVASKFLPYIHDSKVIREQFEKETDFDYLYYVPFYRYIKYDSQIGFREGFKTLNKEATTLLNNQGYYALGNKKKMKMRNDIRSLMPLVPNKYYEDIKLLCKKNNIKLISIMTPMCENTKGMNYFEKVKKAYPEIYNYENVVVEDQYFSSCGHMNDMGAKKFTAVVINDFF